jgi:NitT/TauT family transport system substrate-binding protein
MVPYGNGGRSGPAARVKAKEKLMSKKKMCLAAALLLAAVLVGAADSAAARELTVLVPKSTASLPLLLLAEQDPLPGVDLRVEVFINHPRALARLLRGDADLLYTGTSQGWENHLGGGPLVLVNTGTWGVSYLMGRDPGIRSFADLKGLRLAVPFPGSPLDFQTRTILHRQGLDPDREVTITYASPPQAVGQLLQGQIDAAPLPEPLATSLEADKKLVRLIAYTRAWAEVSGGEAASPQVSLFATRSFSREHEALIAALVAAWRLATEQVAADPEAFARSFAVFLELPPELAAVAVRHTLLKVPSFAENRRLVLGYYAAVKNQLPGARPPLREDFFFRAADD